LIKSKPTLTLNISPVKLTLSPARTLLSSPKITTPTISFSKFNTKPYKLFEKITNSPDLTLSNPLTRAIPSPTLITIPLSPNSLFWLSFSGNNVFNQSSNFSKFNI